MSLTVSSTQICRHVRGLKREGDIESSEAKKPKTLQVSSSSSTAVQQSQLTEVDDTASLSDELLAHIFSFLPIIKDLEVCRLLNRRWYAVSRDTRVVDQVLKNQNLPDMIIGPKFWNENVGKVEKAEMSRALLQYLCSPCPYLKGKRICDTHIVTYIPSHVDGEPLTLERFGILMDKHSTEIQKYSYRRITPSLKILDNKEGHWFLMFNGVLTSSRFLDIETQKTLLQQGDEVPKLLDATVAIMLHYFKTKETAFIINSYLNNREAVYSTYTRSQETVSGCVISVGGISYIGILDYTMSFFSPDHDSIGLAPSRTFKVIGL